MEKPDSTLLMLHGGALGDLALALRLALDLAQSLSVRRLTAYARVRLDSLRCAHPQLRCTGSDGLGLHWLHRSDDEAPPGELIERFRDRLVLNLLSDACGAPHRRIERLAPRRVLSVEPRPSDGSVAHILEQWRRQLEAQGVVRTTCSRRAGPRAFVAEDAVERGREALARAARTSALAATLSAAPLALIHPGSGGVAKCWPIACFTDLAARLIARGFQAHFLTGPVEQERWSSSAKRSLRDVAPLVESADETTLLGALSAADLLISNDAGPAHVAALIGTPSLTLFGPTPAPVWRPAGEFARVCVGPTPAERPDWGLEPGAVACVAAEMMSERGARSHDPEQPDAEVNPC